MDQADEFLTLAEVAQRLRMARQTVRTWLRQGKLKGVKFGPKAWQVRKSDLEVSIEVLQVFTRAEAESKVGKKVRTREEFSGLSKFFIPRALWIRNG